LLYVFFPKQQVNIPLGFQLVIDGLVIERVNCIKFLGVQIDNSLNGQSHISDLCTSLRQFIGIFYKISTFTTSKVLKLLYFSLVYPKILYGIEIYANTYQTFLHDLMILNNRILRIIQKADRTTHVAELYSSYNTLPIDKLFIQRLLLHAHAIIYKSPSIPPLFYNSVAFNNEIHDHYTRSSSDLHRASHKSVHGTKTISNLCAVHWNSLPLELKTITSPPLFKKAITSLLRTF